MIKTPEQYDAIMRQNNNLKKKNDWYKEQYRVDKDNLVVAKKENQELREALKHATRQIHELTDYGIDGNTIDYAEGYKHLLKQKEDAIKQLINK